MDILTASLTSDSRHLDLSACEVTTLEGREAISQPFQFRVGLDVAEAQAPSFDALSGANVTLKLDGRGHRRKLHAMVVGMARKPDDQGKRVHLELDLRPRLWRSSLVKMYEIHQKLDIPSLIANKLGNVDLRKGTDVLFELQDDYPERDFVVQWDETDLAFISRLAEHLGIAFVFAHDDTDKIRFVDGPTGFLPLEGEYVHDPKEGGEGVYDLREQRDLIPTFYFARDYDYRHPDIDVRGEHALEEGFAGAVAEYGPNVRDPAWATRIARIRAEESLSRRDVLEARSKLPSIEAGRRFQLAGAHLDHDLLVVEVEHRGHFAGGDSPAATVTYENRFRAVPGHRHYRPPRVTPVPRIPGLVTGSIVTKPHLVERYAEIDDDGRYWVRLMCDPTPAERRPSVETRLIQAHAGPNYGIHFPLKPGIEVLVAFVNGDPDRPIIVGAAPNAQTPSPINASTSTDHRIRTRSGITIDFEDGVGNE
ncbi:MAG: type VI secretion system tip protein TssI/VgrG [Polyangiaceae bacterium]